MTLPTSGNPISLNDVRIELEKPSAIIALNDAVVRNLAGKGTGMISLSDLYGKTSRMSIELTRTIYNFNLISVVDSIQYGYRGPVNLNMLGVVIRGTVGSVACNLYGQFGDVVFKNPHGFNTLGANYIVGHGGAGGAGGTAGANNGLAGSAGGVALKVRYGGYVGVQGASLTYPADGFQDLGNWLSIYGGGGGGGGGGGASINQSVGGNYSGGVSTTVTIKAAGGGGGAGYGGQSGGGGGSIAEGGGAAGSGQTPSASGAMTITSTAPTAGAGAGGYYITQYYSPDAFAMHRSMDNAAGGTGGKVVAVEGQGTLFTATGGNGGKGGVYAITDAMAGSAGNIGPFSGSVGSGGAPGAPGRSIVAAL